MVLWHDQGPMAAPARRTPYVVGIIRTPDNKFVCAGAPMDLKWVLTAAHCVHHNLHNSADLRPLVVREWDRKQGPHEVEQTFHKDMMANNDRNATWSY